MLRRAKCVFALFTLPLCFTAGVFVNCPTATAQLAWEPDPVTSEFPKTHGLYLDAQYRLHILEDNGEVTIYLLKKQRAPGGPTFYIDEATGEPEFFIRFEDRDALARIRAEVLFPAMPNYLKNPGQRYRITVEGLQVAPDYNNIIEVDAANALDAFQNEIQKLMASTFGIRKEALYYGGILSMQALNQSNCLPATIPLTVLRSEVGEFRIQGGGMNRARQPRIDRFAGVEEGQSFSVAYDPLQEQPEPEPLYETPEEYRGRPTKNLRPYDFARTRFEPRRRYFEPIDPRRERLRPLHDPEPDRGKPGLPGKALTEPEGHYPALVASQLENLEILMGTGQSQLGGPAGGDSRAQQGFRTQGYMEGGSGFGKRIPRRQGLTPIEPGY